MQITAPKIEIDVGATLRKDLKETMATVNKLTKEIASATPGVAGELKATSDIGTFLQALGADIGGEVSGLFGKIFPGFGKKEEAKGGDEKAASKTGAESDTSKLDAAQQKSTNEAIDGEKAREKANAKAWAGIVGNAVKGSKAVAKIRKAFAIAEVVKDTAIAVSKAAASAAFPLNLPAIAFATATGAAQLALVKGQAHDGLDRVPSTGTYLLEKGERVVDKRLNADLSNFLNVQNGARGGAPSVTNQTHAPVISPSINLTLNGDVQPDAVHSNRGALESMIRGIFADYAMEAPFGR